MSDYFLWSRSLKSISARKEGFVLGFVLTIIGLCLLGKINGRDTKGVPEERESVCESGFGNKREQE